MRNALCCMAVMSALVASKSFAQERIVPIEDEPKHVLKFQNAHVRFFDVQLPPGYQALWHTHLHDGVFVNIAPSTTTAQDLGGQPQSRPGREPGETYFLPYSAKPKAHRVANTGDTTYHVTDTEIHRPCGGFMAAASAALEAPIVDNARVRVTRILLAPGERIALHTGCGMLVAVQPAQVSFESLGPAERLDMQAAGFKWRDAALPITLVNVGDTPFHGVDIIVK